MKPGYPKYVTHGHARLKSPTRVYVAWCQMRARCNYPKHDKFAYYGGRGIKVCQRWDKFENFLADMGEPPTRNHSIDRINGDGNYEPGNCRWATRKEQMNNRKGNVQMTFQGRTQTLPQWCDELGLASDTVRQRLKRGWSDEKALTCVNLGRGGGRRKKQSTEAKAS